MTNCETFYDADPICANMFPPQCGAGDICGKPRLSSLSWRQLEWWQRWQEFAELNGSKTDKAERPAPAAAHTSAPAIESGVVNLHAPFFHHLLELAVADRIRHIPAHAPEDDLSPKTTAFKIDHRGAPATKPPRIKGAAKNRAQVCDRTIKSPTRSPTPRSECRPRSALGALGSAR